MKKEKAVIIGIGSVLREDDALGVRIVEVFENEKLFGKKARLVCGDISGLDILKYFEKHVKVIVIDAADMKLPLGTVKAFKPEEIITKIEGPAGSSHGFNLTHTLEIAKSLNMSDNIVIIGIQPSDTSFGLELSEKIRILFPQIVKKTAKIIEDLL
ncbi:MAG: hydrogenase maturation protease [Candidatus Firestonebacteria bacterium]